MKPVKGLVMAALFGLSLMAALAYMQDQASKSEDKELNLRAYIELIRADVKAQRVGIITQIMQFDDAQVAFWPIFREYDFELGKNRRCPHTTDSGLRQQLRQHDQ